MTPSTMIWRMFWTPSQAMRAMVERPRLALPVLLLLITGGASAAVAVSRIDPAAATMRFLEQRGQLDLMTDEARQEMIAAARSPARQNFTLVAGSLSSLLTAFLIGSVYLGMFSLLGRQGSLKAFYGVTFLAFLPLVIRSAKAVAMLLAIPPAELDLQSLPSIGPAVFLDRSQTGPALMATVDLFDFIQMWILTLLSIGYATVVRKSVTPGLRVGVIWGSYFLYGVLRVAAASAFGM